MSVEKQKGGQSFNNNKMDSSKISSRAGEFFFVKPIQNLGEGFGNDPLISLFYNYLSYDPFFGILAKIGYSLTNWTKRRIVAKQITLFFGERGVKWLKKTGRIGFLKEVTGGRDVIEENAALNRAISVLGDPPSEGLKDLERTESPVFKRIVGRSKDQMMLPQKGREGEIPAIRGESTLSLNLGKELEARSKAVRLVIREFFDPSRRQEMRSDDWRKKIIDELCGALNLRRYREGLPLLEIERQVLTYILKHTSTQEMSPPVLKSMAAALGDCLGIWMDRLIRRKEEKESNQLKDLETAIRIETTTGRRADASIPRGEKIDNFSMEEALSMTKALVAICFRMIPEAREVALQRARELVGEMDKLRPSLKSKNSSKTEEELLRQWDNMKQILNLPRYLPKEMMFPLNEYLQTKSMIKTEIDINKGVVLIVLGEKGDFKKIFAWCALHFPQSREIIIRVAPSEDGSKIKKDLPVVLFEEHKKPTDQAYDENLLSGKV